MFGGRNPMGGGAGYNAQGMQPDAGSTGLPMPNPGMMPQGMMPPWMLGLNFGLPGFGGTPPGAPYNTPLPQYPGHSWPIPPGSNMTQGGQPQLRPGMPGAGGPQQPQAPPSPQYFKSPAGQSFQYQGGAFTPMAGAPIGAQVNPLNAETLPPGYQGPINDLFLKGPLYDAVKNV